MVPGKRNAIWDSVTLANALRLICVIVSGVWGLIPAWASGSPTPAAESLTPTLKVQRLRLSNGLTVLALEDHTVPSAAYYTVFKVGSRNERPGITGLSHLFEHMMFNGSSHYRPKVFDQLIEAGGGYSNAFTDTDTTEYQEEFSSATLDTVLRLESDRMAALRLDKGNLEQERAIVLEEWRVNTYNSVEGSLNDLLWNTAYIAHPYRWTPIGFPKDVQSITLPEARNYFRTFYTPSSAVVAVVGDFDTVTLFRSMQEYFGGIPHGPARPPVIRDEPAQLGQRSADLHKPAELPEITMGFHIGTFKDPDDPALDVLSAVLSRGESSRLYHSLVYEKQIASSVSATNESRTDPGLFTFFVQAQQGHTASECQAEILAALAGIQKSGVSERELQKAKNGLRVDWVNGFKTNMGRATLLAEYEANWGDWHELLRYLPKHDRVTTSDVQRVSRKYFSENNRTVVTLIPMPTSGPTGQGGAPAGGPVR